MGDGTEQNPLTREDVLKAIEASGGPENTNLSEKWFEKHIDLRGLNNNHLQGITLDNARFPPDFRRDIATTRGARLKGVHLEGAHLRSAHLEEADLSNTHLEGACLWHTYLERAYLFDAHLEGANLRGAHLEGADLSYADLEGADLTGACLEGARLTGVGLSSDTRLENVDWGNYILAEERKEPFDLAADSYRQLKQWYTDAGMYDVAGKFFYREMEARRKSRRWKAEPHLKLWDWILRLLCGYGEEWRRVIISATAVMFGLALIYFAIGTLTPNTFLNSLYYSAVSFTALGYGTWAPNPTGWVKGLGAVEAFVGVFMMALFLVTFTRKMTR